MRTVTHNLKITAILKLPRLALRPLAVITTQSLKLSPAHPAGNITMERCGCQAISVFRWGQLVDINSMFLSAVYEPETMRDNDLALMRAICHFSLDLSRSCFGLDEGKVPISNS
jgi:hypothetical protein